MNLNLTSAGLEFWLRKKEYKIINVKMTKTEILDSNYIKMEKNNRILGRSFHHTFEKWHKQFRRIPTPQEFVAMQMQDIRKNFSNPVWKRNHKIDFSWTPIVEKGIKNRLLRSYKSFINELHTELLLKELYPSIDIKRSDELDFSGIDILAYNRKTKVEHKIHITKASEYAITYLFKKEGKELEFRGYGSTLYARPLWKKINHSIYENRNFAGHTFFLYSEGTRNPDIRMVNGYPLFTKSYVTRKIEADNIRLNRAG